jgi:hypothetical protein
MKRALSPLVLLLLALGAECVAVRLLSRVDLVDRLMVRGQISYGVVAAGLLATRFFTLFVGPGWLLATLVVGTRRTASEPAKPET